MSPAAHEILESARVHAGMSLGDLWLAYVALGGRAGPDELGAYLRRGSPDSVGYDLVAQAINEHFVDQGADHPVPYSDELESS